MLVEEPPRFDYHARMSAEPSSPAPVRVSEQEYLAHYADLKPPYEFVNGEVSQKPMTKRDHTLLQDELQGVLREYRRQLRGAISGPTPTVNISRSADRRYRAPDVGYWAPGKPQGTDVFLPPTLAVEIQSEGQTLTFLRSKCREYLERGVDVAWLILPSRRVVEVFVHGADPKVFTGSDVLTSPELPGLAIVLSDLFAVLDG